MLFARPLTLFGVYGVETGQKGAIFLIFATQKIKKGNFGKFRNFPRVEIL